MDINPWEFKSDFYEFEFGTFCTKNNCDVIFLLNCWLNDGDEIKNTQMEIQKTREYWILRLLPLLQHSNKRDKDIYVCISNRVGKEKGTLFCGCSGTMKLGYPYENLGRLDKEEEGILIDKLTFKK